MTTTRYNTIVSLASAAGAILLLVVVLIIRALQNPAQGSAPFLGIYFLTLSDYSLPMTILLLPAIVTTALIKVPAKVTPYISVFIRTGWALVALFTMTLLAIVHDLITAPGYKISGLAVDSALRFERLVTVWSLIAWIPSIIIAVLGAWLLVWLGRRKPDTKAAPISSRVKAKPQPKPQPQRPRQRRPRPKSNLY